MSRRGLHSPGPNRQRAEVDRRIVGCSVAGVARPTAIGNAAVVVEGLVSIGVASVNEASSEGLTSATAKFHIVACDSEIGPNATTTRKCNDSP